MSGPFRLDQLLEYDQEEKPQFKLEDLLQYEGEERPAQPERAPPPPAITLPREPRPIDELAQATSRVPIVAPGSGPEPLVRRPTPEFDPERARAYNRLSEEARASGLGSMESALTGVLLPEEPSVPSVVQRADALPAGPDLRQPVPVTSIPAGPEGDPRRAAARTLAQRGQPVPEMGAAFSREVGATPAELAATPVLPVERTSLAGRVHRGMVVGAEGLMELPFRIAEALERAQAQGAHGAEVEEATRPEVDQINGALAGVVGNLRSSLSGHLEEREIESLLGGDFVGDLAEVLGEYGVLARAPGVRQLLRPRLATQSPGVRLALRGPGKGFALGGNPPFPLASNTVERLLRSGANVGKDLAVLEAAAGIIEGDDPAEIAGRIVQGAASGVVLGVAGRSVLEVLGAGAQLGLRRASRPRAPAPRALPEPTIEAPPSPEPRPDTRAQPLDVRETPETAGRPAREPPAEPEVRVTETPELDRVTAEREAAFAEVEAQYGPRGRERDSGKYVAALDEVIRRFGDRRGEGQQVEVERRDVKEPAVEPVETLADEAAAHLRDMERLSQQARAAATRREGSELYPVQQRLEDDARMRQLGEHRSAYAELVQRAQRDFGDDDLQSFFGRVDQLAAPVAEPPPVEVERPPTVTPVEPEAPPPPYRGKARVGPEQVVAPAEDLPAHLGPTVEVVGEAVRLVGDKQFRRRVAARAEQLGGVVSETQQASNVEMTARNIVAESELAGTRQHEPARAAPRPEEIVRVPTRNILADPERFQFKELGPEGVSRELKDVEVWKPLSAGVISVWKDPANGLTYVVNGHHRLELAQRLGIEELNVQYIDATTAEEARAEGAILNIGEGRGTPVDVGKFLRDTGRTIQSLRDDGIGVGGQLARKGLALSRLAPDIFDEVALGRVKQTWGVAIGEVLTDPALQRQALAAIRGTNLSEADAREVARQVGAVTEDVTQETLFGTETDVQSLFVPRAQLASAIQRKIRSDKKLAKAHVAAGGAPIGDTQIDVGAAEALAASSDRVQEIFQRLYTRTGPVADIVTEGARRLTHGESIKTVVRDIYPGVNAAVQAELSDVHAGGVQEGAEGAPQPAAEGAPAAGAGIASDVAPAEEAFIDPSQSDIFGAAEPVGPKSPEGRPAPVEVQPSPGMAAAARGMEGELAGRKPRTGVARAAEQMAQAAEQMAAAAQSLAGKPADQAAMQADMFGGEELVGAEQTELLPESAGKPVEGIQSTKLSTPEEITRVRREGGEPEGEQPLDLLEEVGEGSELGMPDRDEPVSGRSIGYRLRGNLKVPEDWNPGESVSRPQVMNILSKITAAAATAMGKTGRAAPIRFGRVAGRRTRGVFKVEPEVIRTREAYDLPTAAHEIAHATEKIVFGWPKGGPWKKPRVSRTMQQELAKLGKDLYGETKPAGGYKREGFAEFWKFWITEDPTLKRRVPEFSRWFEEDFLGEHPALAEAAEEARAAVRTWRTQGARERVRLSMVDPASPKERLKKAGTTLRRAVSMEKLVEMAQPLYEIAREAERQQGKPLQPSENPYTTMSALRTTHAARTKFMVEEGMIDLAGNLVGPSLTEIRGLVEGRQAEFGWYLWARRAVALWEDPLGPRDPGISHEDALQLIDELSGGRSVGGAMLGPTNFEIAANKVYDWNAGVLDYAAEASPSFAEVVDKVRERDPGDYIPLQRLFEEMDDLWARSAGRAATARSPVKRLRGSGRRVKEIFAQIITQAEQTLRAAHARMILDQVVKLSRIEGMGHLIEEIPVDQIPAAAATLGDLIDRINKELFKADPKGPSINIEPGEAGADSDLFAQTLTFFAPATRPKGVDPVIPIREESVLRWYRVDGKLFDALGSLDVYRLPDLVGLPILEYGLGKPAAAFRAGTTGLRASFGLIWNPIRDVQTMLVNSASSANGPKLLSYWMKAMVDAGLNRGVGLEASPELRAFLQLGGEMAQPLGQDIPHTRIAARRMFQGRAVRALDPRNWFEWYREFVQFPEMAPRVAELKAVAKDIGWEPGQPMTLDQSLQLLLAAKQVTTDFTAAGEFGRIMNRMVPFHNAAIQGPRANIRAARRNPQRFVLRGLQLTAATLALWWLNKDEEWYKELNARDRFLHWWFPTDWPEKTLVKIPRAFEVGLVFSSLPEALVDGWYRQDPQGVADWFDVFRENTMPNITPVLVGVGAEQLANKNFYFDTPIVPMGEQRKPAEEQYNEYTSRISILLGDLFNASPRRIDHAVKGIFGYVAGDILSVLGLGAPDQPREKEAADIPLFGRLFRRGGDIGTRPRSIQRLYDTLEEAQRRQASDRDPETDTDRQRRLMLSDAAQAVTALSYIRRFTEKKTERQELTREALSIAQDVMGAVESGKTVRSRFSEARRSAQSRRETLKGEGQETPRRRSRRRRR